jgi:hypothetical protein
MKKYIAITPKKGEITSYLTNNKAYKIIQIIKKDKFGKVFIIFDDNLISTYCREKECLHLNGLNWKIKRVYSQQALFYRKLTIMEAIFAVVEWIIFGLDFIINNHFNIFGFIFGILFTILTIIFFIKFKQEDD